MLGWCVGDLEADVRRYRDGISVWQDQDRQLRVILLLQVRQGGEIRLSVRFRSSRLI